MRALVVIGGGAGGATGEGSYTWPARLFPHPTLSESLAEAARDALGKPIYLPY